MKVATYAFVLPLFQHQCSITMFSRQSQLQLSTDGIPSLSPRKTPISLPRYRRRYSNTKTFRNQNTSNFSSDDDGDFGKRRRRTWFSGDPLSETGQESGTVGEIIDSVWILKVFLSYGLMLPAIIVSIVLATGPKAFLMALALPIGQSALTLAFTKLWGAKQDNPKRKTKTKPRVSFSSYVELEEEEEKESKGTRKGKAEYQSWVSPNDVSINKDSQIPSNFGGWDDLDRTKGFDMGSSRSSTQTGRSGRTQTEKGKFSRRERRSDTPFLLRLLIAAFPFLSSWTKML
ncbi:TRNA modification GTPase [Actinidia chinensis var. chinensis]|uniref:tRNA modification GTPase n=1 Tax=Actinidia chinensis var. chinensis TaxID=1590841 RepID=A0A2R6PXC6_ACTCC|nr:TRNA modification GTPase [Actinidia chinensis var. chinensis]